MEPDTSESAPENPAAPVRQTGRWKRVVIRLALLYVVYCAIVYFGQRWAIFPDWIAPEPSQSEKYDASTTVLTREIDDGNVIAWFVAAPGASAAKPAPLVLFLHGNAEIIDTQDDRIEGHRSNGCSVLLPEYRSYGRSAGSPSQAALVDDAIYFLDLALKRPDVDADRLVIHGRSMGGGIAAQVAAQRKPRALILGSTFTSMRTLGSRKALVPAFLVRHPMDTAAVLRQLDVPLLIFHGTHDNIISVDYGRELNTIATQSRLVELNCSHNDFPGDEDDRYWTEIRKFLEENGVVAPLFHVKPKQDGEPAQP